MWPLPDRVAFYRIVSDRVTKGKLLALWAGMEERTCQELGIDHTFESGCSCSPPSVLKRTSAFKAVKSVGDLLGARLRPAWGSTQSSGSVIVLLLWLCIFIRVLLAVNCLKGRGGYKHLRKSPWILGGQKALRCTRLLQTSFCSLCLPSLRGSV